MKFKPTIERATTGILVVVVALLATSVLVPRVRDIVQATEHDGEESPVPSAFVHEWKQLLSQPDRVGDSAAPLQVIEFLDLQCEACKDQHTALESTRRRFQGRMSITYIHFPLDIHPFARGAAHALICARRAGKVEAMLDELFSRQDSIGVYEWNSFRAFAGIEDSAGFDQCMRDDLPKTDISAGLEAARRFLVTSTPTVIINGWRYNGAMSAASLDAVLSALLEHRLPPGVSAELSAPSQGGQSTVSEGGRIVTYTESALHKAPQLMLEPRAHAVFGSIDDDDYDLSNLTQTVLLSDGRLITFARIGGRLLAFTAKGRGERVLGRQGRGPLELQGPGSIAYAPGDSIVTLDRANRRLFYATASEGVVRERPLPEELSARFSHVAGVMPDKSIIVHNGWKPPKLNGTVAVRGSAEVLALSADGDIRSIGRVDDGAFFAAGKDGRDVDFVRFTPQATVRVWDSVVVLASGEEYRLTMRRKDGSIAGIITLARGRRPVTKEMRAAEQSREVALRRELQPEDGRVRPEDASAVSLRFADSLPAFDAVHISPDNTLWVVDPIAPTDTSWAATAFRLDGAIVGRLQHVGKERPVAFGKDRVAVRSEDAYGLVTVRTHRLLPVRPK